MDRSAEPWGASPTVVVGVDFSAASAHALTLAQALLAECGSDSALHVVHVVNPLRLPDSGLQTLGLPGPEAPGLLELDRDRLLELCRIDGHSLRAHVEPHIVLGDVATEIAGLAREVCADLIVVGAQRRHRLHLHASVASRLLRRAPCSVLTAFPREARVGERSAPAGDAA